MAKKRILLTPWLLIVALAYIASVTVGCSGTETVQASPDYNKLSPDEAKKRLGEVLKHRGQANRLDQAFKQEQSVAGK